MTPFTHGAFVVDFRSTTKEEVLKDDYKRRDR